MVRWSSDDDRGKKWSSVGGHTTELLFFTEKPPELLIFLEPPPSFSSSPIYHCMLELVFFIDPPLHAVTSLLHRATTAYLSFSSSPETTAYGASLLHEKPRSFSSSPSHHRIYSSASSHHRSFSSSRDNTRASLLHQATTELLFFTEPPPELLFFTKPPPELLVCIEPLMGYKAGTFEDIVDAYLAYGVMSRYNSQRTSELGNV
ncbi:hypothetical protein Bca101_087929 [Brassica carinata]